MTRWRSAAVSVGLIAVGALVIASDAAATVQSAPQRMLAAGNSGSAPSATGSEHRAPVGSPSTGARPGTAGGRTRELDSDGGVEQAGVMDSVTRQVAYSGSPTTTFNYPGAEYVKVHFARLLVRPGDWVTVSDPNGQQAYTYRADPRLLAAPEDSPSTRSGDGFWSMSITGDTALVTLHRTLPGPDLGNLGLKIDRVAHGFTAAERSTRDHDRRVRQEAPGEPESACGGDDSRDAVCYQSSYPTEYQHSLPVARLLINGTTLCTAWRVGANNRMLTNNHCIASSGDVQNTEVWFNYQCTSCGGQATAQVTKVPGNQLLRTDHTLDYTLFTVSDFDSISRFGHLDLDPRTPSAGEQVYIPQHPEGSPTKLAIASDSDSGGNCRIESGSTKGYAEGSDASYKCDTQEGSSGSPVISRRTQKVIALHHLGGCPNTGVRIDLIYAQIRSLL